MRKNTLGAICTFFFFSFIMLFVCMVTAQEVDYPCSNYIVKGKFDKAEEKLLKDYNYFYHQFHSTIYGFLQ